MQSHVYKILNSMLKIVALPCNFIEENCYIIWDEGHSASCWVVDCGALGAEDVDMVVRFITSRGLNPVRHLLTHGHFDHIFGAQALFERYNLSPTLLKEERETYEQAPEQMRLLIPSGIDFGVPPVGELLCDKQTLTLGNLTFEVIATPGHTPGGCCYYCKEADTLISGDTLFRHSYGRTDLPGGNGMQLFNSLKKLLALPEQTKVYPGHGPTTTISEEQMLI